MTAGASPDIQLIVNTGHLRFAIGEFTLFTRYFDVGVPDDAYRTVDVSEWDPNVALKSLPSAARGVYLPGWPTSAQLPPVSLSRSHIRYVPMQCPRYFISIDGSFDDYLQNNFSAKSRYNLKRSIKKFEVFSDGRIDLREFVAPQDMPEFHLLSRKVSSLTYQERLMNLGLSADLEFTRALERAAAQGMVRGYVLAHRDRPIAFAYCTAHYKRLYYNTVGYDPAYSQWSPGTILLYLILERVFAEARFREFDFGPGEAHYKTLFSTNCEACADAYYFPLTLRNSALVGLHFGIDRISAALGSTLATVGVKSGVRRLVRRLSLR